MKKLVLLVRMMKVRAAEDSHSDETVSGAPVRWMWSIEAIYWSDVGQMPRVAPGCGQETFAGRMWMWGISDAP